MKSSMDASLEEPIRISENRRIDPNADSKFRRRRAVDSPVAGGHGLKNGYGLKNGHGRKQ
jgi:hypothetical protein